MRIGTGFDVHKLVEGRKLVLGGVEIPYERGLLGHSDADVLTHAVMDALLGAAGLPDIGMLFPDTAPEFEGVSSMELLFRVRVLLKERGYRVVNVDATIIAERPKIRPYKEAMIRNIAAGLGIPESDVNVKGTTTEGLGFTGRGEGIAAEAVCLIETEQGQTVLI